MESIKIYTHEKHRDKYFIALNKSLSLNFLLIMCAFMQNTLYNNVYTYNFYSFCFCML